MVKALDDDDHGDIGAKLGHRTYGSPVICQCLEVEIYLPFVETHTHTH